MMKKLTTMALKPHTNAHAVRDRPTLKDVRERTFRSGSFQGLSNMFNMPNKFKRVQTSSYQIVDDHSKNITNDNTNDSDKTNYTEVKSSQDTECSKTVSCEEMKVEVRQELSSKTSAILENNNQPYHVSHEDVKITKFLLLLICFLLLVSSSSLLNGNIVLNGNILVIIIILVAFLMLVSLVYVRLQQSVNNVLTSLENDCNLFEKAVQFSVDVNTINKAYISKQCLRSRYAKFLASKCVVECVINKPRASCFCLKNICANLKGKEDEKPTKCMQHMIGGFRSLFSIKLYLSEFRHKKHFFSSQTNTTTVQLEFQEIVKTWSRK